MTSSGIYQIQNIKNNNKYIGSAINLEKRRYEHFRRLRKGTHPNSHLQNSFNLYGESTFKFLVVEICENKDDLISREQAWIDQTKPEYNISPTAGSSLGIKRSPETRAKIGAASKGRQSQKGRKHSEESKNKMRESHKGSLAWNRGKTLSDEHKRKLRISGLQITEERKARISASVKAWWSKKKAGIL